MLQILLYIIKTYTSMLDFSLPQFIALLCSPLDSLVCENNINNNRITISSSILVNDKLNYIPQCLF